MSGEKLQASRDEWRRLYEEAEADRDHLRGLNVAHESHIKGLERACDSLRAEVDSLYEAYEQTMMDVLSRPDRQAVHKIVKLELEVKSLQGQLESALLAATIDETTVATAASAKQLEVENRDLRAKLERLRNAIRGVHGDEALYGIDLRQSLEDLTSKMDEHPEGYDGPCWCRLCQSYGAEDGVQS